jgi:tetratricopeptide (TPR) repeat protein
MKRTFIHRLYFCKIILIVFLFPLSNIKAQKNLDSLFAKDLCFCLNKTKKIIDGDLERCMQYALEENTEIVNEKVLEKALELGENATEEDGYKFGYALGERATVIMIGTCDLFFHYIDSIRYDPFINLNKDSLKSELIKINHQKELNKDFFTKRALLYFQINDIKNSLSDYREALKLDPYDLQTNLMIAWTLERNKNYDEAYLIYKDLATISNKNVFNLLMATVKRKRNSTN